MKLFQTIVPSQKFGNIAEKHHGETVKENLCWSCSTCNGYKGSDIASYDTLTKQLTPLYHPRTEHWQDHFALKGAEIIGLTAIGCVTIAILQLNEAQRLIDREGLRRVNRYPCAGSEDF